MPLWPPYAKLLESKIADLNHISGGPFAGSVTAALFLTRFVEKAKAYVHFDIYAWNPTRAARAAGGRRGAGRAARLRAPEGALRRRPLSRLRTVPESR